MKPSIFIASSVEGLNIAYAIQKNLIYDGEVTVWSQGAFNPSNYVLEDLIDTVDRSDFGIFVFSPDDETIMRNETSKTIRDNVLFEMGLFMGKLGRKRVFAVRPNDISLHIPTDLFGLNVMTYENARQDNNLVAGTGSACNDIRNIISKLGMIERKKETIAQLPTDILDKNVDDETDLELELSKHYDDKDYARCIEVVETMIPKEGNSTKKIRYKCFKAYMISKDNFDLGEKEFDVLESEAKENERLQIVIYRANAYMWEEYYQKSIDYINKSGIDDVELILVKSKCMVKVLDKKSALSYLNDEILKKDSPLLLLAYFEMVCEYNSDLQKEDKQKLIKEIYKKYPNNEDVIFKYAYFAHYEIYNYNTSLFLWSKLVNKAPKNANYLTYLGNAYSSLNFHNHAIEAYEKANIMVTEKSNWLLANIGNFYSNRGIHFIARKYLNKALELKENDEYSYKRLAEGLEAEKNERNEIAKIIKLVNDELYINS